MNPYINMISLKDTILESLKKEETVSIPKDFFTISSIEKYLASYDEADFRRNDVNLLKLGDDKDAILAELKHSFGVLTPDILADDVGEGMINHIVSDDGEGELGIINRTREYLQANLQDDPKGEVDKAQLFFATYNKDKTQAYVLYSTRDNPICRAIMNAIQKTYE